MTRSRSLLTTSVLAILASAATPAMAGTLTGRVSDGSGATSLQSAEVEIVELGRKAQTGADGVFRFADVPDGNYTLRVRYVGSDAVQSAVQVAGDTRDADVRLGANVESYIDNILVVGQRANLSSSLSRQRAADGVENVLSRDAIGQFPDQNVAESLRRVPGINILNDQGEGRFVAVRGLDPNLNAASINGARVPAPEADVRSVALDVIPAEIIDSIEIKKSLTPDMDADTIGASIEIHTTSAFDRRDGFLSVTAESSYNDLNGNWSPKGSADFSTMINDRLGLAGGISYYKRDFSTDNIEMDGWNETDDGLLYADTVEYRDYDVERERLGGSLSLDFRLNEGTDLYARMVASQFDDQEYRGRLIFEMEEEPLAGNPVTPRAAFTSDDGEIQVVRDLKDRFETQDITSLVLGGDTFAGAWTYGYSAAWSKAREKESGSLDPVEFQREFADPGELSVVFDYGNLTRPTYSISPAGQAAFYDAEEYEFDQIERTTLSLSEDEEITARFDIAREFSLGSGQLEMKAGAKVRQREKTYDLQLDVYDGFDGDLTLADLAGGQTYGLANISPVPDFRRVRNFIESNFGDFELNDVDTAFESAVADYAVDEDIYAGYLMGTYDTRRMRLIAGVRMERTENTIGGNLVELVEEGGTRNGTVLDEDTVFVTPSQFEREYTDWLPSLNLRFEATENVVLRAGAYRSVVRPGIGQLAPRFLVEENDDGDREGEFGNPDLKPYDATNVDLSAEWYFSGNGVLQAGLFFKRIDNFIVSAVFEDVTFNGVSADEALIPINGEEASVNGFEFNYQQSLSFLPIPLDGFLLGFNFTYTDSEGDVLGRAIPLPASSKYTWNGSLGYEKGPFSLRLAATYRDEYLDELGDSAEEDRYVKDHTQFDVSAKYRITPQAQLFMEFINLGDEPYTAFQRGSGRERLLQYEEYSWTGKAGVRFTF